MRHLSGYGPLTYQEVAFALSIDDDTAKRSLESLVSSGEVSKGRFIVADNDQYMPTADRLRLRSGKSNVFDADTVERYR